MTCDPATLDNLKQQANEWFSILRDRLCTAFEALEDEAEGPFFTEATAPGRFERDNWQRDTRGEPGGGGTIAMMRGRVFEKVGVHVSVLRGQLPPELRRETDNGEQDPQLWAAGISLIAHPWNPHAPTGHMNTRFIVTSSARFGGGADLTPMLAARRTQEDPDSILFHAAMQAACAGNAHVGAYQDYRKACDDYFHIDHRNEPRGIGGIFYDRHWSGNPAADLAFTRDVGEAFLGVYPQILRRNIATSWTEAERIEQEIRRGRYVEFNLLQDRGTLFGLKTGGNIEAILSSLPPRVRWP